MQTSSTVPFMLKRLYSLMYAGDLIMSLKEIIRDLYIELCSGGETSLTKTELAELNNIYMLLKKYSIINLNTAIPEIAFIYILALEYKKMDILDSITPVEDLYAELDYIFPKSYLYSLPFVVKFYHAHRTKKTFNSIRFKQPYSV